MVSVRHQGRSSKTRCQRCVPLTSGTLSPAPSRRAGGIPAEAILGLITNFEAFCEHSLNDLGALGTGPRDRHTVSDNKKVSNQRDRATARGMARSTAKVPPEGLEPSTR